ncbi:MAG: ferritin-like domain-containing protein [Acidobacteriota bacterium]
MPIPIDFAKLAPQDILDIAAFIEHEAQERYEVFAVHLETQGDRETARFFRTMAQLEATHGAQVEGRRVARFADLPGHIRDVVEWDVEGPPLDRSQGSFTAEEALDLALASEVRAREFFAGAQQFMVDPQTAAMLAELHRDEVGHIRMLEEQKARLVAPLRG